MCLLGCLKFNVLFQIKSTFTLTLNSDGVSGDDIAACVNGILSEDTNRYSLSPIDCGGSQAEYGATDIMAVSQEYQCATGYMVALPGTSSSGCGKTIMITIRGQLFKINDVVGKHNLLKFQIAILQIHLFLVEKNVRILCNAFAFEVDI